MEYFKLADTTDIPVLGCGTNTYGKENHAYDAPLDFDTTEIESAIEIGYRHFDTAISYRNEEVVALGIEKSGEPRTNFFLTSKLAMEEEYVKDEEAIQAAIEGSLTRLKTDYIDLYLIHRPLEGKKENRRVWRVLEGYAGLEVLRSIGVSNFSPKQLEKLLKKAQVKPAVNQIESHPGKWNDEIIDFCKDNGVLPVAWGPLRKLNKFPELKKIADKYDKTPAQIVLRYQIERGVAVIPKSHSAEHQKENFEIFDFELSGKDRKTIRHL